MLIKPDKIVDSVLGSRKDLMLEQLPEGHYELQIPYSAWRAQGRFRYKLRQEANLREEVAKAVSMFILVYVGLYMVLPKITYLIHLGPWFGVVCNFAIYGCLMIVSYPVLTSPSNIQIGKQGLRLHWLHSFGKLSSPWIAFDWVEYVTVSNMKRGYYKSRTIDFYIDKTVVPAHVRNALRLIAPSLWCVSLGDKLKLRLDIAAITHEADLPLVLRSLKNLLPAEKLGPELIELEEQHPGQSFTKLWLDNLDGGDRLRLSSGPLEAGEKVFGERYEIVKRLAAGGQAVTYLAQDMENKKPEDESAPLVVLKEFVLPVRGGFEIRRRALENVEHEAKLLEKLDNEHIVKLIDCFVDGQRAYLVLEYIGGKSLRKRVQDEGALTESEAIRLGIEMCQVLDYMHTLTPPLVHRDFTPENLLLRQSGELALIDFNVAEQLESMETRTMVGKHCYVPPEQFRGKATTQSDIYACGCSLYWLLTGQDPEPITCSHPSQQNANVSAALDAIVARATTPDVAKRYGSAAEMLADLVAIKA